MDKCFIFLRDENGKGDYLSIRQFPFDFLRNHNRQGYEFSECVAAIKRFFSIYPESSASSRMVIILPDKTEVPAVFFL